MSSPLEQEKMQKAVAGSTGSGRQSVWIDGALVANVEARISPFDHGLMTGDGVFETMAAYGGKIFAFRRHFERLGRSAGVLGIEPPGDLEGLRDACHAVIAANGLSDARVRITVTGGEAPLGSEKGAGGPTVIIAAAGAPHWGPTSRVHVVAHTRNESGALAGVKSTSYGENVIALSEAKARGADEAIFGNTQGALCEGTGSNVFLVEGETVVTPPLSSGCLAGVTRGLVLELCAAEGIAVVEENRPLEALAEAEEAFLSSTTREVHPIAEVSGTVLPRMAGEITKRLQEAFKRLVAENIDP